MCFAFFLAGVLIDSCVNRDVLFIMDSAQDVGNSRSFDLAKDFVIDVARRLEIGQNNFHVAAVYYAQNVENQRSFQLDRFYSINDIENQIRSYNWLNQNQANNMPTALTYARTSIFQASSNRIRPERAGDRYQSTDGADNAVIIVNFGTPTQAGLYTELERLDQLPDDTRVFIVNVGNGDVSAFRNRGYRVISIQNANQLNSIIGQIISVRCPVVVRKLKPGTT